MFVLENKIKNKSVYHWLIVAACSGLAMAAIGISINCAGIFFAAVSEELGVGRGDVSLTVTLTNVVTGLMGPLVASRLFGRVNIKNFNRDWLRCDGALFCGYVRGEAYRRLFMCSVR